MKNGFYLLRGKLASNNGDAVKAYRVFFNIQPSTDENKRDNLYKSDKNPKRKTYETAEMAMMLSA